jgi:hypothetical protein
LQLERNHLHHTRQKQPQSSNSLNLKSSLSPNPSHELQRNLNQEQKYHNFNPGTPIELNAKHDPNHRQAKNKYCNLRPNLNPEHNLSDSPQDKNLSHKPNPQSERNPNPNLNQLDGYQANPRNHCRKHPRTPNTQFLLPTNNPQPGDTLHSAIQHNSNLPDNNLLDDPQSMSWLMRHQSTPHNNNLPDNNLLDNHQIMSWLMRHQSVSAIAYTETALA